MRINGCRTMSGAASVAATRRRRRRFRDLGRCGRSKVESAATPTEPGTTLGTMRPREAGVGRNRHRRLVILLALVVGAFGLVGPTSPANALGGSDARSSAGTSPAATIAEDSVTAFGSAARAAPGVALTGLAAGLVGIASTPDGGGYWLVAADGGVFAYGDAAFHGSTGGMALNAPVVGMAATPDGRGYWLVAADGGVFAYGDAGFHGSTGGMTLNAPVVGMASGPGGGGYWLVAGDGGIFAFGDAPFDGSTGALTLNAPVIGMAAAPGGGYWLAAADGGVFAFGDAPFEGSDGAAARTSAAVGIAGRAGGYWIAFGQDRRSLIVPAIAQYVAGRSDNVTVAIEDLDTGAVIQFRPGVIEHTASTLKVDILATLLERAQSEGRGLTPTEQSLAVPMIEDSLDSAADILWEELGPGAVGDLERQAGMTSTVPATDGIWGTTTTSALDRVDMVKLLAEPNGVLSDPSRAYVLNLMEHITPSQDWGATGGVPPGVTVALKNGFAVINGWQINTEGWVDGDGRNYLIGVLTNGNPSEAYGIDTVDAISSIIWQDMED